MNNKNLKLIYIALGALMLVLLKTSIFQNSISSLYDIGFYSVGDMLFKASDLLSAIGVIIFIIIALKLIYNNIKDKES